jgi:uncharacterized DUF497 family protein
VPEWYENTPDHIDDDAPDDEDESFEWDDGNLDHLRRDISPGEVEEAMLDPRRRPASAYSVEGEQRRALVGATEDGRVLYVVYTLRSGRVRVISSRNATRSEQRQYRR